MITGGAVPLLLLHGGAVPVLLGRGAVPLLERGAVPLLERGAVPLLVDETPVPSVFDDDMVVLLPHGGDELDGKMTGPVPLLVGSGVVPLRGGAVPLLEGQGAVPLDDHQGAVPLLEGTGAVPLEDHHGAVPLLEGTGSVPLLDAEDIAVPLVAVIDDTSELLPYLGGGL